jgi:hypothetical protein
MPKPAIAKLGKVKALFLDCFACTKNMMVILSSVSRRASQPIATGSFEFDHFSCNLVLETNRFDIFGHLRLLVSFSRSLMLLSGVRPNGNSNRL